MRQETRTKEINERSIAYIVFHFCIIFFIRERDATVHFRYKSIMYKQHLSEEHQFAFNK